ncbi:MAG: LytR/AlgR family response regulator transcription factor [Salibacteraceae bacterium]
MSVMNCIVVDDDPMSTEALKKCIENTYFLKLVDEFASAEDALEGLSELSVDLIFLDVEMPGMSGIEFIRSLKDVPQIIITSAKSNYAAEAFDYNVTDYIVKPVDLDRFQKSIERVRLMNENFQVSARKPGNDVFFVKEDTRLVKINAKDISYIEAKADYVSINTTKKRHTILSTMKAIESKLDQGDFVRIHRSFIVRLDSINEIDNNVVSIGDKLLPVSRSYKVNLMEKLNML